MPHIYLIAYIIAGLVTAIATMRIFPPMAGFRPGLPLRMFALLIFVTLWPVLISLAVWYLAMGYIGRHRDRSVEPRGVDLMGTEHLGQLHGSKPR